MAHLCLNGKGLPKKAINFVVTVDIISFLILLIAGKTIPLENTLPIFFLKAIG